MTYFIIAMVLFVVFLFASMAFLGIWVYKDAEQRGLSAGMWAVLVILSGLIGLILYLAVGRKESPRVSVTCSNCGAQITTAGTFCATCGEKLIPQVVQAKAETHKTYSGFLVACIVCVALAIVCTGISIFSFTQANGFMLNNRTGYYVYGLNGHAKKVAQNSSGDMWDLSFEEASDGYVFKNTYNAKTQPLSMELQIETDGYARITASQNDKVIDETIGGGVAGYEFDMSDFKPGKIDMKITNVDASRFSGKVSVKTSQNNK